QHFFRIMHENLKLFYREDNLPGNIERLNDDAWYERQHIKYQDPDVNKFNAYVVWFFIHVDLVKNKEEILELFEKIQSILMYNLGDFGLEIFHGVLTCISEYQKSESYKKSLLSWVGGSVPGQRYPVPGKDPKDWSKLLTWYVRYPEELEKACDILRDENHINHLLGKDVDAEKLLRALSRDNIGINLLKRYIEDQGKLRDLCDCCNNHNIFMRALFDIACREELLDPFCIALSKDRYSPSKEKDYKFILEKLPLILGKKRA
ncbi:unnamed protein product, partial [marine sediment metagenome]